MSTPQYFPLDSLPGELQREIFTAAVTIEPRWALRLALVARRVNEWVQPLIYETVTLGSDDTALFLRTINSKPAEFFATYVKRLCLTVSVSAESAASILSVCTGVVSLALWVDFLGTFPERSIRPFIEPLPLRRLSIEFEHYVDLCRAPTGVHRSWCRNLTHLGIIFWTQEKVPAIPGLSPLVSLTHLALRIGYRQLTEDFMSTILTTCHNLCVLVILLDETDLMQDLAPFIDSDPRVVLMSHPESVQDWEAPGYGLPDTWSRAEAEVQRQRHGRSIMAEGMAAFSNLINRWALIGLPSSRTHMM